MMEIYRNEEMKTSGPSIEIDEMTGISVIPECDELAQREMDDFLSNAQAKQSSIEQCEMDAKLGYSSEYYEYRMETALENGNKIAYNNAKRDWAKAKAKETT